MSLKKSTTNQSDLKTTMKSALVIFLPLLVILSSVASLIYYLDLKSEVKVAKNKELQRIEFQKNTIAGDFNAISSRLLILSELKEDKEVFKESSVSI